MDNRTRGSALLLVLLLSSFLSIICLLAINTTIWMQSMQQAVHESDHHLRLAHGMLKCAIARAKRDFELLTKNKKIVRGTLYYNDLEATMSLEPVAKAIRVSCHIVKGDRQLGLLSASVGKKENGQIGVLEFSKIKL